MLAATRQRFLDDYIKIRHAEGRGSQDSAYYLALPYRDITGRLQDQWTIRAKSYRYLERRVLPPIEKQFAPAAAHRRPGRRKLLAVVSAGAARPPADRHRHPGRSAGRPRRRPPLSEARRLPARQRGVRRSATGRGQPRRGHLQRVHSLLHRLSPHAHRNPPVPAPGRLLSDCRFARLPAPRARRNDGPRAPPAVPDDLRLRLRHAAQHRVLRHGNARRTGPRPGHFVEGLSSLVWLAMGDASVEGALARQASALAISGFWPAGSPHDHPLPSAQHQTEEPPPAAFRALPRRGARRAAKSTKSWTAMSTPIRGDDRRADAAAIAWSCSASP